MNESILCEHCGSPLPQTGGLAGACPRCIFDLALESTIGKVGAAESSVPGLPIPTTIARYRILRVIGEGAMGTVYEAEQDQPRRTVALKIIKPGISTPELQRRFEQESQALGRLQHPGIAQIYEAGTADTGFGPQPYFAMELIRGKTLGAYAKDHHLNTRQRLEMVARIAEAVQHAHQRGLIHRDLKPGNIMVDETGHPKVLDFGIARATDSDRQATSQTDMGQLVGTLAYMSPEQVLADPLELDTRSDVYSLGVILYELLAGRLPYPISKKLDETIHAIREEDPARLSTVNRSYRGDIETIVARALEKDKTRRYGSAAELAADIQRYLHDEPIVARPPSSRYQLQKFVRRHQALVAGMTAVFVVLVGGVMAATWEATVARRERDQAIKARNERDVALSAAETAAAERTVERDRATSEAKRADASEEEAKKELDNAVLEKNRADTEAAIAKAVRDFLGNDLLRMANPLTQVRSSLPNQRAFTPNPDLTVKEALDRAAMNIGGRFDQQPLVEVAIRETIGGTYVGLGAYVLGQKQYEIAVELRSRVQGAGHPDTLRSRLTLASIMDEQRLWVRAEEMLKKIVEDARHGLRADDVILRNAESLLVSVYQEDSKIQDEFAFLKDDVIPYEIHMLGEDNAVTMSSIRRLVELYKVPQPAGSGQPFIPPPRYMEAEAFLREIIADERRKFGAGHFSTLTNTNMLAGIYIAQNKFKDAEDLLSSVVPETLVSALVKTDRAGLQEHPTALESMGLLVEAYTKDDKPAQADALLKNVMYLMDRGAPIPERDSASSLVTMVSMAGNYLSMGRDADAAAILPKALEAYRLALSSGEPGARGAGNNLLAVAQLYLRQMKYAEAQRLFRETLEIQRDVLGEEALAATAGNQIALTESHSRFGTTEYEKSEQFLGEVLAGQRKFLGDRHTATRTTMWALSQAYWDHGKSDMAQGNVKQAQISLEKTEATIAQLLAIFLSEPTEPGRLPGGTNTGINKIRLANVLAEEGKYEKAEEAFLQFVTFPVPPPTPPQNPQKMIASLSVGWLRLQGKRYSEAEPLLRETLAQMKNKDNGIPDDEARYNCEAVLGATLVGQKRYMKAEGLLLSGYLGMTKARKTGSNNIRMSLDEAVSWIVRLYQEWGKPEEAAKWQEKLGANKVTVPAVKP